jgi:hypothetical protein
MRPILFGLLALSLGCLGIEVPSDHTATVSGTFGLARIAGAINAAPCYTSTKADPTLPAGDVNIGYLSIGSLVFVPEGTATFNAHYEVRHQSNAVLVGTDDSSYALTYVRDGMDLKITWKGIAGNGQIFPGDGSLWTRQPWCAGLSDASVTQRMDFDRK